MARSKQKYGTKVEFLGGNNEYRIGASSILIEHDEENKPTSRILIDDGAMFPPDWISYDSAIPDMRQYFDSPYGTAEKPIDALVVTHCHEDHIGALSFLAAAKFKLPPIFASEFTANLIKQQMKNNNVPDEYIPQIEIIREGETIGIGDNMKISPFNISHSTAGAFGFHIGTTVNGKDNAGLLFTGDYHLDKVPFGQGFDEELYKEFISDKKITHIFFDSTSGTSKLYDDKGKRRIPDFNQAVENVLRVVQENEGKQIFSPVIARSVQNLAIDIKVAALTGRTILVGSKGLRNTVKDLFSIVRNKEKWVKDKLEEIKKDPLSEDNIEYTQKILRKMGDGKIRITFNEKLLRANLERVAEAVTDLMQISPNEKVDLEKVIYNAGDIEHTNIEDYLRKYPEEQRYMIISGAMLEDKDGRKSTLVVMSEQNKVTKDKDGKSKGKGQTGHPQFTVNDNTLILCRQRFIEAIIGDKWKAPVARLQSLGATVIINGDTLDAMFQRTGHATIEETRYFQQLTLKSCKNHKAIEKGTQDVYNIAVHGDPEQLSALLKVLHKHKGKPLLCFNSDVLIITPEGTTKEKGKPFAQQDWICVRAESMTGAGSNDLFVFDLCDHNLMQKEHLFTVMNVSSRKGERLDSGYIQKSIIETAQKLEDEGMSMSNTEIRFSQRAKHYDNRRGEELRMSYNEYQEYLKTSGKNKGGRGNQRYCGHGKGIGD